MSEYIYISSDTELDSECTLWDRTSAADSNDSGSDERSYGSPLYDSDDSANWGCLTSDSQSDDSSFLLSRSPSVFAHSIHAISSGSSANALPFSQGSPPATAPEANLSAAHEHGTAAHPIYIASSPSLTSGSEHAMSEDPSSVKDTARHGVDWPLSLFDENGRYRTERFEFWFARTRMWLESNQLAQTMAYESDGDVALDIAEDHAFAQRGETTGGVDQPEIIDLTGLTDDEEWEMVDVPTSPTVPMPGPRRTVLGKLKTFCSALTTKASVVSDAPTRPSGRPSARNFFKRVAFGQERSLSPPSPPLQESATRLKRKRDNDDSDDDEPSAGKKQKTDCQLLATRAKVQRPRATTSRR